MSAVEGWTNSPLGQIAKLVKGITYSSEDYCAQGEGAVFITIKCVSKSGGFKQEGIKFYKGPINQSQELQPGDLLIANTDLTRDGDIVGAPIVVPAFDGELVTMSMDLSKLVEVPEKVDRTFLYYKLMTDGVRRFMKDHASGSTVLHLQTRAVPSIDLDYPEEKAEQAKIVEVLSTLDRAIEQTEVLIAKQQRIKTGLMQDLLTKGIDAHGNIRSEATHAFKDSPLGRIPVEWCASKLSSLTTKIVDGVHHTPVYVETGVPFITITDLTAGDGICFDNVRFVTESDHKAFSLRANPAADDVLVTKDGTLGVARIVPDGCPIFSIFVSVAQLRPKKEICTPELIWSFFESGEFKIQLGALSAGTGLAHIHLEHFREFLLRVPPIHEQGQIFEVILEHQNGIQTMSAGLEKLIAIKKGVMSDLLSGNRRVTPLLAQAAP